MHILIIDDEVLLTKGLKRSLELEGYRVSVAHDGKEGLEKFKLNGADFILLDLMLPGMDGISLCKKIREISEVPILMLTAKDDPIDKVLGLEMGADDYLTKPFNTRELLARIKAISRRLTKVVGEGDVNIKGIYHEGDLTLNEYERRIWVNEKEVVLTQKEFDLVLTLIKNKGRVLPRGILFEMVWGEECFDTRTVDVHIRRIREKIENDPQNPVFIKTKWGVGYYFNKGDE